MRELTVSEATRKPEERDRPDRYSAVAAERHHIERERLPREEAFVETLLWLPATWIR